MIKLAVFDIDGTLAPIGKPIAGSTVAALKELENCGVRIALSSGKPIYYQIGMFRQVGLKAPIFIGENGCEIAVGVDLPPEVFPTATPTPGFLAERKKISEDVTALCGGEFWLQPNSTMLTFFFSTEEARKAIHDYFAANTFEHTEVYEHSDSFDIIPKGVDKFTGLRALSEYLRVTPDEMVAVGDGINDIPMFRFCRYSIGVGPIDESETTVHFSSVDDAIKYIQAGKL